jgi:hypothetical protein
MMRRRWDPRSTPTFVDLQRNQRPPVCWMGQQLARQRGSTSCRSSCSIGFDVGVAACMMDTVEVTSVFYCGPGSESLRLRTQFGTDRHTPVLRVRFDDVLYR